MTTHLVTTGDLAYFDSAAGLVPVKVTKISDDNDGRRASLRVTADHKPWRRGEMLHGVPETMVVARRAVQIRSGQQHIVGSTTLVPSAGLDESHSHNVTADDVLQDIRKTLVEVDSYADGPDGDAQTLDDLRYAADRFRLLDELLSGSGSMPSDWGLQ